MLNSKNERGAPNAKGAIIEKVLSVRRKLYLSTASIHLLSVYHPENNAPTSLSLKGSKYKAVGILKHITQNHNRPPHVLDDRVNGGKALDGGGGKGES